MIAEAASHSRTGSLPGGRARLPARVWGAEGIRQKIQENSTMKLSDKRILQDALLFRETFIEVEKMKEWPIDLKMFGALFGPVIVPILLYLLEEYLIPLLARN